MKMNRNRVFDPAPDPEPEPAPSPRPRRSRRILRLTLSIAGCLLLLLMVCAAGLVALVNTDGVHRYLIGLAQRKASEQLGVRVHLENFTLHWSTLSLDLYGISVDGAAPYPSPRLLAADHVAAGVRVVSVFGRKWYFDNLQIDHPVAWVVIDKNGVSNLPVFKSGGSSSHTSVFDLGIRRAVLSRGEVYFNSRPAALDADLHDLNFRASFNSLLTQYSGSVDYTDGRVQYGEFRPFAHSLAVDFDATPLMFHLKQAKLASGPSQLVLSGSLEDYAQPDVRAHYDAIVDGTQMGNLLRNASLPAGLLHADGDLAYRQANGGSAGGSSLMDALTVQGRAASRRLEVKAGKQQAEVDNLAFDYALAGGNAALRNLRAQVFGGALSAEGQMNNIGGDAHSTVKASLHGVSLQQVQQALLSAAERPNVSQNVAPPIALTGTLNASASATFGKTLDNLTAHADASLQGNAARAGGNTAAGSPAVLPIESVLHANYFGAGHRLDVGGSYLRTPQTTLTLNGTVSENLSLAVRLQANDLREAGTIADLFAASAPNQPPLNLAGSATFTGTVSGSTETPHLTGQLAAENLQANGTSWKALRAGVDLSPSRAALRNVELDAAARGRVTLNASADLAHWSFTNQSPVQAQLHAAEMNVSDLMKMAGRDEPVAGTLNASLTLHGSVENPQGSGSLTLTQATVYAQPVQTVKVNFSGSGDRARPNLRVDLRVDTAAGSLEGEGTVEPRQKTYTAQLSSTGIRLEKLEAVANRNGAATGVVTFQVKGQGAFDNPELDAHLEIPKLDIQGEAISNIQLQAHLENRMANATLASSAAGAEIQAKARVELTNDYQTDATLDTKTFPLGPLLAAYAPDEAESVNGETEIHASVHGPLRNRNLLEAHVAIPVLKIGYGSTVELAAASPIRIDYKNGVLNLQPASIKGTDTDLQLQAAVPVTGNALMALTARGTVNLQLIQLFDPDLRSSGEIKLNIDSRGPIRGGSVGGQIEIANANLSSVDMPVGLVNANGVLTLTGDRINVDKFEGTMGGGTVTAQGGIAYRPNLQFGLIAVAKDIRILYPQGMRENVNASLNLAGTPERGMLGGSVDLTDLSFTPAFDLNSFLGQFSGGVSAPQAQGFTQNLALNIAVRSTSNVNLVSRTLSVGGSANLQVRGTAANPVILGRVNLSGGDIILNGSRFVLTGGSVQFVNPSETQPVVNLNLSTTIQEYNIDMRFNGPVDQLRTEYSSNPALPQADIINLLAFGETTEAAAANGANASANQTAESLVASQVSSEVTGRISKAAGISQLSISPVLAGSSQQGPAGAVITIRQRVTGNLFVTFSSNVATTQNQTIQGQYQVSPRVAISATRDPNGGFGVDALIKKSW
jgi:translocation and assembly module TamB